MNAATTSDARQYDIVLYGATSFVGQLVAAYLVKQLKTSEQNTFIDPKTQQPIRLAIAGRSAEKLAALKQSLNTTQLATLIADSEDASSLDQLTKQTRLVISTVGPYLQYGEPLIKACAANGTHYVDLCGEAIWIRMMVDKYQASAEQSGAKIVNACGFDSLPSDLGVWFTQQQAQAQFNKPCETIHMRVKKLKGGFSGGTIGSMLGIYALASENKRARKQLMNPYLLNTDPDTPRIRQHTSFKPVYSVTEKKWLAPFIMASINTRIVHRSNYLMDYPYGRDFKYEETMWLPATRAGQLKSYALSAGLLGFGIAASFKPTREFLANKILPKSGEGPSKQQQESGHFTIQFIGTTKLGEQLQTTVTGDKDPGYAGTAKMLSQAALCLLQDTSDDTRGFWTPASIMAAPLINRLEQYAGVHFNINTLNN